MRLRTWTRRTSRAALAASYLVALVGPIHPAAADGWTIDVSADEPYVDWSLTLDGETLLHVIASSGRDCDGWDMTQHVDPYLILFNDAGEVARNDDGNHNETGDCFSAKLHLTPEAGDYVLRFTTYQRESVGMEVPTGSMAVSFSTEGWSPPTTTTTTSTSTTTSTTVAPTTTTEAPPSTTSSTTSTTTTAPPVTTSTSTLPPTTTTTLPPTTTTLPPTSSTSTSSTTSTTTTSTTTVPPTTTSTTTSTSTTTTVPPTTSTTSTLPPTTSTSPPTTTTATSTTTTTVPPTTTTTTLPEPVAEIELEPEAVEALAVIVSDADVEFVENVTAVLETIVDDELDEQEIEALVETFEQVVEAEAFEQLDLDQIGALGGQINSAPDEVKEIFEEAAADEMFDGTLDDYVATNSTIDNGDRRTVIAVTAASTAALAMPRPTPPSAPTAGPSAPSGPSGPTRKNRR